MRAEQHDNTQLSTFRRAESLRLQLDAFQEHLAEVDSVIGDLIKYSSTELESFWLIRNLIVRRISELRNEFEKLEEGYCHHPATTKGLR